MNENLELVLKFPKEKPPYIGILFSSVFHAGKLNQEWIQHHGNETFRLTLEPKNNLLELVISHSELGLKHVYKIRYFHPEKLKRFLEQVRTIKKINFGHVVTQNNEHIPVRTVESKQVWVLAIGKIELLINYY